MLDSIQGFDKLLGPPAAFWRLQLAVVVCPRNLSVTSFPLVACPIESLYQGNCMSAGSDSSAGQLSMSSMAPASDTLPIASGCLSVAILM